MTTTTLTSFFASPTFHILLLVVILLALASCISHKTVGKASPYTHWFPYYGADAKPEDFKGYDLLVFDADRHPDIAKVKAQGSKVLAYLSISEITENRAYFERFKAHKIGENSNWQSTVIDLRQPSWRQFIITEWLPATMARGFD